jgi:predicted permease
MLANLISDIRYAANGLLRSPGFATAAILTIALGVGINTAIFSILNGLILRDLPVPAADELVTIYQRLESRGEGGRSVSGAVSMFSTEEYRAYRDGSATLAGVMGFSTAEAVTLGGGEAPQEISGVFVTCNYFDVLRQTPALGRGFAADNCETDGATPAVVLAHDLWQATFQGDPDIVGREVLLNRQTFVVAGVAPARMHGPNFQKLSFFAPIATQPLLEPAWDKYRAERLSWLSLIGRKAPDASLRQVRAELAVIGAQIDAQEPGRKTSLIIDRARSFALPEARTAVLTMSTAVMGAFALVLLIACANVANLLLARASVKSREIAVKMALGANRSRVVQQLLVESTLISLGGGLLGSLLALWSVQSFVAFVLSSLPASFQAIAVDSTPDALVLGFALALTLATGLLFGLAPAAHASKPDLQAAMKHDTAAAGRRSGAGRLQRWLIGVQLAVCMMLMLVSALLLRGLYAAQSVEPGFEYEDIVVTAYDLVGAGYDAAEAAAFNRELLERVAALPGVTGAAQILRTPLSPGNTETLAGLPGQARLEQIGFNQASPSYFNVVGIPLVRGRTFTDAELAEGSTAAIVTETTAQRYWPGQDAIGQVLAIRTGRNEGIEAQIVGVARDTQISQIGEVPDNYVYLPTTPPTQARLQVVARSETGYAPIAAGIRQIVRELDEGLVVRVEPLEANLEFWRSLSRLVTSLAAALGALALVLAAVGVYGVVAYAMSRRTREIGIRMALGANAPDVLRLVLAQTMRPVVIGAAVGLLACAAVSRILASVLFGVSTLDPLALVGGTLFVLGVALAAGALPARRAASVDPTTTLHHE